MKDFTPNVSKLMWQVQHERTAARWRWFLAGVVCGFGVIGVLLLLSGN